MSDLAGTAENFASDSAGGVVQIGSSTRRVLT